MSDWDRPLVQRVSDEWLDAAIADHERDRDVAQRALDSLLAEKSRRASDDAGDSRA